MLFELAYLATSLTISMNETGQSAPSAEALPARQERKTRECRVDDRPDAKARCAHLDRVARELAEERDAAAKRAT
jgi:hypothetical protein